jgi:hypothetical protein
MSCEEAELSDIFGGAFSSRENTSRKPSAGFQIKRIINGKTYNTETASVVFTRTFSGSGAGVVVYQTRHGAFFWIETDHDGELSFMPKSDAETQALLEECHATEALEQYFGPFPEGGAAETRWTIRIPGNLAARVEAMAKKKDMSVNSYAMRCFERCVAADAKAPEGKG